MRRSFLPGIVLINLLLSFSRPIQADLVTSDIWVNAGSAAYPDETSMTIPIMDLLLLMQPKAIQICSVYTDIKMVWKISMQ